MPYIFICLRTYPILFIFIVLLQFLQISNPITGLEAKELLETQKLPGKILQEETEPLIIGKEGRNYLYKNLFRRGQNYYESFHINGEQVLIQEKELSSASDTNEIRNRSPQFIPEFSQKNALLSDFERYAATDFVELFFEMENFPEDMDTLDILNRLLQMNTMAGIQYFSTRKQQMTTYITSSSIVEKARSKTAIPPPVFYELPQEPIQMTLLLDDNRFTKTWFDVVIAVGEDHSLRVTMTNITPMYVQFIFYFKVLDANKIRHEIIILPDENNGNENGDKSTKKPIIYALSQIHNKRTHVMGIKLDLANSFNRRVSAIQSWISGQIYS